MPTAAAPAKTMPLRWPRSIACSTNWPRLKLNVQPTLRLRVILRLKEILARRVLTILRLIAIAARLRWIRNARATQLTPQSDWRIWLIMAGRGWGKTRVGAEDIAHFALRHDGARVAVVAPTFADARDVCVEGESGLLSVMPEACIAAWHRSTGDLMLNNGSRIKLYSADQPDRLRGPQHHRAWCDELAAWPNRDAFDQLAFGLRLGDDPRMVVTTTPRNTALIRELVAERGKDVYLTHGRTMENAANLPPRVLATLTERYGGTRLGRQELDAELLSDTEGALWQYATLDAARMTGPLPTLRRVVIGVDPALSHGPDSDETGIVAAGRGEDGLIYVLADRSGRYAPDGWARRVAALAEEVGASAVVAEVNAGGNLVERVLRTSAPHLPFRPARALRGKMERALPVAALYEQGRVRHAARFAALEDQMTRFCPDVLAAHSPDRVDALVWAITALTATPGGEPRVRGM